MTEASPDLLSLAAQFDSGWGHGNTVAPGSVIAGRRAVVTVKKVITDQQSEAHDCSRDDHLWDKDDKFRWCTHCGLTRKKL